ncbi:MASE3 domain-containing sensor histidine kinase [Halothermothrix orenii]|uniref:histidine kinase n=1 Tax=Halothermothrix orenii (strain H 168 / OCM 544 / DSM 9562) TaxID=373903 RepID=B8CW30_HALOH|nr:MASE3 domain-containing protein [Halothermothrix orenii]ACL69499.1 multi-sensor signal transduction histidine kinase [Halothermothrix orenii H 168]
MIKSKFYVGDLPFILLFIILFLASFYNYIFFHSVVELLTIITASNVFIIAFATTEIGENNYFKFLGLAYGFVAFFDLLHMTSCQGLGIFPEYDINLCIQFWIVARLIESISLLVSFAFVNSNTNNFKKYRFFIRYIFISVLFLVLLFYELFPLCYHNNSLTNFKVITEYAISFILLLSIIVLKKSSSWFSSSVYRLLFLSLVFTFMSELLLASYLNPYGFRNILGHLFKLVSFYLIYKSVSVTSLKKPFETLFYKLNQANKKLKNEKNKILDITEAIFIFIDKEGKITLINKKGCEVLGYQEEEIIGKEWVTNFVYKDDRERVRKTLENIVTCGCNNGNNFEHQVVTRDNTRRTILWKNTVLKDERGQIRGVLSSGLDITDKKLLEEELEYNKLRTEFFANLSHEFKTPLNVIFSALHLIEWSLDKNPLKKDKIKSYLKTITHNSYRLLRLITNLLDITKIDANSYQLNICNCDIVKIVKSAVNSVKGHINNKTRKIVFNTNVNEKIIACDPFDIERILYNLLSNAIKFTGEGDKITVEIKDRGQSLNIIVKDTGIGIPEEMQDYIFKRFRQVDKSFRRNNEGSGLGLSLTKSLVELHGGSISIESKPGKGSTFIIKLPVFQVSNNLCENTRKKSKELIDRINLEFSDIYEL